MNNDYYTYVILELTYDLKVENANNDVHIFCNGFVKPIGDLSIIVVHNMPPLLTRKRSNQAIMSHIDH